MYHILGFRFSSVLYYEMQQSKKFRHINGKGKYSLFSHSVCKQFPKDYILIFPLSVFIFTSSLLKWNSYNVVFFLLLKGIWATTLANEKKLNRAFKVSSLASLSETFNTTYCYILKYQVSEIEQTTWCCKGFRGFTCHYATAPGKTISRVDSNQLCITTGLRKHYNFCITFEISSSKYLLYVLSVLKKRRYLGLFVVQTDAVKNANFNVNICA